MGMAAVCQSSNRLGIEKISGDYLIHQSKPILQIVALITISRGVAQSFAQMAA
jgi:hypothetical protein